MCEIWIPIKGYEGLYEVSSYGRVRSLGNGNSNNSKIRVLNSQKCKTGYLYVTLTKNGNSKKHKVHRLVAIAFLPNWFDDQEVNHIDEDKTNNQIDNLEWCDRKYNCNHGTRNDRMIKKLTNGPCSKPVLQFTKTGELVREWASARETGRNGFDQGHISACCRGESKTHKGYIWKYK